MKEDRWTEDEIETIALVNRALGEEIWQNTLLVLTFANEIYNVKRKEELASLFVETLRNETGISLTTDDMPVALAGHLSKGEHLLEYGIEYWYTQLFIKGIKQVKNNGADALMLLILYHKDQVRLTEAMKEAFCDIYNHKATKTVFAIGTFTIFMVVLPFSWIPTVIVAAVGTITTALSYDVVKRVTTLDEFCNS
ncbi:PREDICTED: uncharacterized protein LOC109593020 [Amphimedon queenslandica]|uniref:Uncharacterized protein n=1 Tax=Amphimedon queenslandica TaxID=400682 RepID=A0A1X7SI21_AMPQE|nr:PREDICTED: uncharacterized protein LOC109593020 [Amphimedon queenslandica]|eukprot:XP_019863849.1 PREDICTED: uncharacterized protein LOC109593020 [Amphimedon queenslandica]